MNRIYLNGASLLPLRKVEEIAALILEAECPGQSFELSLSCVDDPEMKRLNKLYRGLEEATDVLSFTSAKLPTGAELGNPAQTGEIMPNLVLCDIIIDTKQLERQRGTNSLKLEFISVFVHGLLHLAGYDHIRNSDADLMKQKADYYLKLIQGKN